MLALIPTHSSLSSQKQLGALRCLLQSSKNGKATHRSRVFKLLPRTAPSGERCQPECPCGVAGGLQRSWEDTAGAVCSKAKAAMNDHCLGRAMGSVAMQNILGCGAGHPGLQQLTLQEGKPLGGPNKAAVEDDWGAEGGLGLFSAFPLVATSLVAQVGFF